MVAVGLDPRCSLPLGIVALTAALKLCCFPSLFTCLLPVSPVAHVTPLYEYNSSSLGSSGRATSSPSSLGRTNTPCPRCFTLKPR